MMLRAGMSSTDSSVRASSSRSSRRTGAKETPQLPTTTVVVPCQHAGVPSGSHMSCASRCVCGSMNPGVTTRPSASIVRQPDSTTSPTALMDSSWWQPSSRERP
jgi:hypothetical protein